MKKKIIASLVLGASLGSLGIANDASAKMLDKDGLLKTNSGKPIVGYQVFDGKLYKNGHLSKGYVVIGKGSKAKLYYNGSLKKGYKTAQKKSLLFKDGVLVKGYKQASKGERLYKNGRLSSGYRVHKAADGSTYLYQNGVLKKGQKTVTRDGVTTLYVDGLLAKGLLATKGQLFKDGLLASGTQKHEERMYQNGQLFTGDIGYLTYENGVAKSEAQVQRLTTNTDKINELSERHFLVLDAINAYYEMNKQLNENYKGFMLQSVLDEVSFGGKLETPYYGALADMQQLVDGDFTQQEFNEQFKLYYSQLVYLVQEELTLQNQLLEEVKVLSDRYKELEAAGKKISEQEIHILEDTNELLKNELKNYLELLQYSMVDGEIQLPILEERKNGVKAKYAMPNFNLTSFGGIKIDPYKNTFFGGGGFPILLYNAANSGLGAWIVAFHPELTASKKSVNKVKPLQTITTPQTTNSSYNLFVNKSVIISNDGTTTDKELILNSFTESLKAYESLSWTSSNDNDFGMKLNISDSGKTTSERTFNISKSNDSKYIDAIPASYEVKSEEFAVTTIANKIKRNPLFENFIVKISKNQDGTYLVKLNKNDRNNTYTIVQKTVEVNVYQADKALQQAIEKIPSTFDTNNKNLIKTQIKLLINNPYINVQISDIPENDFSYDVTLTLDNKVAHKNITIPTGNQQALRTIANSLSTFYAINLPLLVSEDEKIRHLRYWIEENLRTQQATNVFVGDITKSSVGTYEVELQRNNERFVKSVVLIQTGLPNENLTIWGQEIPSNLGIFSDANNMEAASIRKRAYLEQAASTIQPIYSLINNLGDKKEFLEGTIRRQFGLFHPTINIRVIKSKELDSFDVVLTYADETLTKTVKVTEVMQLGSLSDALSKLKPIYTFSSVFERNTMLQSQIIQDINDPTISVTLNGNTVTLRQGNETVNRGLLILYMNPELQSQINELDDVYIVPAGEDSEKYVLNMVKNKLNTPLINVSLNGSTLILTHLGATAEKTIEIIREDEAELNTALRKVSGVYEIYEDADKEADVKRLVEAEISDASISVSVAGKTITLSKNGREVTKSYTIAFKPNADKVALEAALAKVSGSYELEEGTDEAAGIKRLVEAEISDASISVSVAGKTITLSKNGKNVTKGYTVAFKPNADKIALEAALAKVSGGYELEEDTDEAAGVKRLVEAEISDASISVSVAGKTITLSKNGKEVTKSYTIAFKPNADKVALEAALAKVSGGYELEEGTDEAAGIKRLVEAEISDASISVSVADKKITLSKNGREVTKSYTIAFKPNADKVALEAALAKVKGSYSFAYDTSSLTSAVKNAIEQAISDATISVSVASDYTVTLARNGKSVSKSVSVIREDKPYVPEPVTAATVQQAASQLQLSAGMTLPENAYTEAQQRAFLLAEAQKQLGSSYSVAIKSFKFIQPVSALSKVKAKVAESEEPQYLTVAVTFDVSRSGYTAASSELQTKFLVTDKMKTAAFAAIQEAMKQPQTDLTKIHPGLQMMLDVGGIFELDLDGYAELQYPNYIGEFRLNYVIGDGMEVFKMSFYEFVLNQKLSEESLVNEVKTVLADSSNTTLYEVYQGFSGNFSYSLMDENADEPFALSNEEASALIMKKIGQQDITLPVLIEAYLAAQPGAEEASAFIKEKDAAVNTITDKSQLIDFSNQINELSEDAKWLLTDEALDLRYDQTLANSWMQYWLHEFFLNVLNDEDYEAALLDLVDENGGTKLPGQYSEHIKKDIYVPLLRAAVADLNSAERKILEIELQRTGYGSIDDYLALFTGI